MIEDAKIKSFDFWYVFIVMLYFGGATLAFLGMTFYTNIFSVGVPFVYTCLVYNKYKLVLSRSLFMSIAIVIIWFLFQYYYYGYFNKVDFSFYIYNILVAYTLIKSYGKKIFYIFEKVMYVLAIISLIGWILCLLGGRDILAFLAPFEGNRIIDGSYGVFGVVNPRGDTDKLYYSLFRNCGFCSEPGHFSAAICIAIVANLFCNNFKIRKNKHLLILFLTLLSTQSTTGYFILGAVIIPLLIINYKGREKRIIYVFAVLSVGFIMSSSVVSQKIEDNKYSEESLYGLVDRYENDDLGMVAQRFDSFMIEVMNFKESPWIGYGIWDNSFFYNHISQKVFPSNGCITVFAKFGLIIGLIYYISLLLSSIAIVKEFKMKGAVFIMLLILCFLFSYDFQTRNLILLFVLYKPFANKKIMSSIMDK